jgi:protocadherin-16/23
VFEIVPGTSNNFEVTPQGFVVTNATLDRETRNLHTFSARATDGFFFTREDAFVEITVTDVNDEYPVFEQDLYEVDVQELTPASAIILIVNAEDRDEGTNAVIRYSISAVNPPTSTGLFGINPMNGAIAPMAQIDINDGDPTSINLTITATDQGPFALSSTAIVAFSLVDRNLEAPLFNPPHYNFSVVENVAGAVIGRVLARENNGDLNTVISYGVVAAAGDGSGQFSINSANVS